MDSRKRYLPCSLLLFLANSALAGTPRVLEEVLVTAQKTTQSAQDVPISLTALDGAIMRDIGATGLADMAPYMPNVRFSSESDPALAQINIRGFGSNPLNAAFESSVGFVQDEIF
ncbi:MAG: iron complex outermembrane receptor protein, partial [Bacteroidia bacterium]